MLVGPFSNIIINLSFLSTKVIILLFKVASFQTTQLVSYPSQTYCVCFFTSTTSGCSTLQCVQRYSISTTCKIMAFIGPLQTSF